MWPTLKEVFHWGVSFEVSKTHTQLRPESLSLSLFPSCGQDVALSYCKVFPTTIIMDKASETLGELSITFLLKELQSWNVFTAREQ